MTAKTDTGSNTEGGKQGKSRRRLARGPRFGIAQLAPALGDLERNMQLHGDAVDAARADGVDVLVFPELSLTGYRLKDMVPDVAAARGGPVFDSLAALSKGISIVVGLVEETSQHFFYNCAVYFEDGKILECKRKVYLPTYGMFDEQRYFARGNRIAAFDTAHGRTAILICEEMLHPSAVTIAALDGAATIIVPSASPTRGVVSLEDADPAQAAGAGEVDANGRQWESYNRVMARALGLHVVYANRAGVEDGHTYWGGSEIIGPSGETLAKGAYYQADAIAAVLPEDSVRRRRIQAPVLRDEDVDLTINELARIRGRREPARETRGDRRDDRPHGGRGGGGRERRDDRPYGGGRDRRDNRPYGGGRDRRDDRPYGGGRDRREDRPYGGGRERREDRPYGGGRNRRDDNRPDANRGRGQRDDRPYGAKHDRREHDRSRDARGGRDGEGRRGGRAREEAAPEDAGHHEPPVRARPDAGERKPRPVDVDGAVAGTNADDAARAAGKKR